MDNASYRHTAAVRACFSLAEQLERFWRFLKDTVCADTLFPDLSGLMQPVAQVLLQQNDFTYATRFTFSKLQL